MYNLEPRVKIKDSSRSSLESFPIYESQKLHSKSDCWDSNKTSVPLEL